MHLFSCTRGSHTHIRLSLHLKKIKFRWGIRPKFLILAFQIPPVNNTVNIGMPANLKTTGLQVRRSFFLKDFDKSPKWVKISAWVKITAKNAQLH